MKLPTDSGRLGFRPLDQMGGGEVNFQVLGPDFHLPFKVFDDTVAARLGEAAGQNIVQP